ncbi:Zn-dependent oligopeptidases [Thiohalobacter thiocyanaticus]|uniref:oligopeptidase A n=1 Tax=Thiohalobacter thiocyanaticus TaxID=585455 RepID=A0A1Z4VM85_9GAMM|nr:oligopeptidase A [Thiohalobacter thiocyanaticus]BAZ92736.1 Zn-dependent oligopeptidases [Thiohalobacter thiocyanaticus]
MSNPLIDLQGLPPFSCIKPEHVEPAVDALLAECRASMHRLLEENSVYSWDNLVQPIEDVEDKLDRAWSPVSHMNSVVNSEALRQAYNACLPKLSDYATEMGQNERLFQAFRQIADSDDYKQLDTAQQKVIDNALRDFRLSGVALPPEQRERYRAVMQELSSLTAKFEENLLDATHGWKLNITDESRLAGLPESAVDLARQTAEREGLEGWLFNLEFPSYYPVLTYADDRELRRELYTAYVTRASDEGPNAGQWDNGPVMERILALRHEAAQLLGFDNYAEKSIATKMAQSTDQVLQFLHDLAERALPAARAELDEIRAFARDQHGMADIEAWDVAYYSEKLREHKYAISQEEVKPWFPVTRVIPGMFAVVNRLYGLDIREVKGVDAWHEDVRFYEIRDTDGRLRGQFYLDLYARPHKRGGAWMDECVSRRITRDGLQTPVAYLTCNFTPPVGDKPALLTHDEVITLFHEFGHGLHHMLTQVDYAGVSGISGVAWDAVELPSQFMENWCWEREALDLIAGHYETGEKLPGELFERMLAAKNFQSAMMMVRQLEFSIFDFRLHREYDPAQGGRVYDILQQVRDQVAVIQPPSFNRFPHSFSHIFAGGYAAGYYSYKWAEVLSADAFSAFEESGIFDRDTGKRFLTSILEQGGSREPMELFIEFRGREPSIDALLRHSGLAA